MFQVEALQGDFGDIGKGRFRGTTEYMPNFKGNME